MKIEDLKRAYQAFGLCDVYELLEIYEEIKVYLLEEHDDYEFDYQEFIEGVTIYSDECEKYTLEYNETPDHFEKRKQKHKNKILKWENKNESKLKRINKLQKEINQIKETLQDV